MPIRASRLWKELPLEKRLAAADAFWRDEDARDAGTRQAEAVVAIAKRLNFRAKSVLALPVARRAKQLAQIADLSDAVATRALIAYHFHAERPMMTAFLDALGIAHDNGLINVEEIDPVTSEKLSSAVAAIRASFPEDAVQLYLKTLVALDEDTWGKLDGLLAPAP